MTDYRKELRKYGVKIPEILLPASSDYSRYAVIACDQHSAEPEYWQQTRESVGDAPSALNMILPEAELNNRKATDEDICRTMQQYIDSGILKNIGEGFVYVKRHTATGIRKGLVLALDLENYSFEPGNKMLIRATEATVKERLPARIKIRRNAPLELPHILVLIDDRDFLLEKVMEAEAASAAKLYDFNLMQGGGRIEGYHLSSESACKGVYDVFDHLYRKSNDGFLFAMGDGNHSLAAAKACWDEIKKSLSDEERENHPMRFALAEVVNIYDKGLSFHPIHRLLYHVDPEQVQKEIGFDAEHPESLQTLQPKLDLWLSSHPEAELEYIHGEEECRKLGNAPDRLSIVFGEFPRDSFFETIEKNGIFVRKSFSLGTANEKRYYLEARKIH